MHLIRMTLLCHKRVPYLMDLGSQFCSFNSKRWASNAYKVVSFPRRLWLLFVHKVSCFLILLIYVAFVCCIVGVRKGEKQVYDKSTVTLRRFLRKSLSGTVGIYTSCIAFGTEKRSRC